MDKAELIQFLKDNLELSHDQQSFSECTEIDITLTLCGEVLTQDTIQINVGA